MKRPILLSALFACLVFCYCFWGLAPERKPAVQVSTITAPDHTPGAIVVSSAASKAMPTVAVPESRPLLTESRRRIMDSRDLMKTVAEINAHGTQDEKDWALYIMMACGQVRSRVFAAGSTTAASEPRALFPVTSREVAKERQTAYETISQRCKGIYALSSEEQKSLQSALLDGSESNTSEIAKLHSLGHTAENRWSDDQANLISRSLYSGDRVMQQEAFYVTQGAIDSNAPGGEDRSDAIERAFQTEIGLELTSELELQTACVLINRCPSRVPEQNPPNRSVDRLADEYRAALRAHKDVRSLLAIR